MLKLALYIVLILIKSEIISSKILFRLINKFRFKYPTIANKIPFFNKFVDMNREKFEASMQVGMETSTKNVEQAHPRWSSIWDQGLSQGELFDASTSSPALIKEIQDGRIPNGKALVPGCGRGYDLLALASDKRTVIGLELADQAVNAAKEFTSSSNNKFKDKITVQTGNFFDLPIDNDNKFDFIYDYTFLCALDPSIRQDWAKKMSELVKPGGILMTLIFPICEKESGPPFKVSLEVYKDLLVNNGFKQLQLDMLPSELCHPGRDGTGPFGGNSGIGRWEKS